VWWFSHHPATLARSCVTPPSGLGGESTWVNHVRKLLFYASLWRFTIQYRRLTLASNVGCRSPKLSTNQVGILGLFWPWNGDSLKSRKKIMFCKIWSLFSYTTTFGGYLDKAQHRHVPCRNQSLAPSDCLP